MNPNQPVDNQAVYDFLRYQNEGISAKEEKPRLIIATCMDFRIDLKIPEKFAYTIRIAGNNLKNQEFSIAYAAALAGIHEMIVLGHTDCGMSDLLPKKEAFLQGITETAGWTRKQADDFFTRYSGAFQIGNEVDFAKKEAARLQKIFPGMRILPGLYRLSDQRVTLL